jgi:hypothetical protein
MKSALRAFERMTTEPEKKTQAERKSSWSLLLVIGCWEVVDGVVLVVVRRRNLEKKDLSSDSSE